MARITFEQLLRAMSEEVRGAFVTAMAQVVDQVVLNELIAAVETGDAQRTFEILGLNAAALRPLTAAIESAFERAGVWVSDGYPRINGYPIFRFDVRNPEAERWLKDHSSGFVTRLTEEARTNVRDALQRGMVAGVNPRTTALNIVGRLDRASGQRVGGLIGLTVQQATWSDRLRNTLEQRSDRYFSYELRDKRFDRTVQKAIQTGKPLPRDVVDKLVLRYRQNALRYRGEQIARTESIQSFNVAEWQSVKQVVATGRVKESDVTRIWDSAGDRRVRPSHAAMDGQVRGVDEPFIAPSGARLMHPGDSSLGAVGPEVIACRCIARTNINWLGV